eukprot:2894514-Rhodomonas_salina.1
MAALSLGAAAVTAASTTQSTSASGNGNRPAARWVHCTRPGTPLDSIREAVFTVFPDANPDPVSPRASSSANTPALTLHRQPSARLKQIDSGVSARAAKRKSHRRPCT